MFKPTFRITNKIIKHLTEIAAARELVPNSPLLPKMEVKLRKEAIVKMAHHSTSIESNPLTLEQVKNLLAGKEIAAWEKDKKEVINYDNMKDFVSWLNSTQANELYPVLLSGISHYELVRIHPFVDGNGRTARALATLILYLKGFDVKRFFAFDDYYNEDRGRYYVALQTVDKKILDITLWLSRYIGMRRCCSKYESCQRRDIRSKP
jgi:Fic family protein